MDVRQILFRWAGTLLAPLLLVGAIAAPARAVERDGAAEAPARLAAGAPVSRLAGADRIGTAVAVSAGTWTSSREVVLASARDFPDALAAGPLAARLDAPLLLTDPALLPPPVLAEVRRLGAERVTLVGGAAAVGPAVEAALSDEVEVRRLAGPDRYATAAVLALEAGPGSSGDVVLAAGSAASPDRAWPDALSAGALTAAPGAVPVLLTTPDALAPAARDALPRLLGDDGAVRVVGGPSAVSAAVEEQVRGSGAVVERLSGRDRYLTSLESAAAALREHDAAPRPLVLATGTAFADGLAAGALAARLDAVLLLVPPGDPAARADLRAWLAVNGPRVERLVVVGGPAALPEVTASGVGAALATAPLVLPPPAAAPAPGTPREVAEELVRDLRAGDPRQRRAAVLAALSWAGLSVAGADGSPAVAADPAADQGVVLPAWQALALAEAPDTRADVPFLTLVEQAAADVPGLAPQEVAEALLGGVLNVSARDALGLQRWSALFSAAGLDERGGYAVEQRMTALQTTLLFTRLAAESSVAARTGADPVRPLAGAANPCTPTGPAATVLDNAAVAASTAFGRYWEYVASAVPSADRFTRVLPWVNNALAAVQVVLSLGQVELTAELVPAADPSREFERTRDTVPGEVGTVRMTVRTGGSDLEGLNCARIVLNSLGMDFSVAPGGPVAGARITATDLAPQLVEHPVAGQNLVDRRTDAAGAVTALVRGRAQPYDLGDAPVPVAARQSWRVAVTAAPNDLVKDLRDTVAGGVGGGVVGAATPLVVRTLAAATVFSTFTAWAPLRDWSDGRVLDVAVRLRTDAGTDYSNGVTSWRWRSDHALSGTVALDEGADAPLVVDAASGSGGWTNANAENVCDYSGERYPGICSTVTTVTGARGGAMRVLSVEVDEFGAPTAVTLTLDPAPVTLTSTTCSGDCGPGVAGPGRSDEVELTLGDVLQQYGGGPLRITGFAPVDAGSGADAVHRATYTVRDDEHDHVVTFTARPGGPGN